jgi:3-oxoadipate enol-lactonase
MIHTDGCSIHVVVEGAHGAPVLMLSNSLGADLHMWDGQAARFAQRFRLVRYDSRGHGQSSIAPGPYSMEQLGRDALAVMDALGIEKVNWCGLSMGGMIGIWLGANAPDRINRLVLSNTTAHYADKRPWDERMQAVRDGGVAAIAERIVDVWFTKNFQAREPATTARMKAMMMATPTEGYLACCAAVRDMDHREIARAIRAPTLIIAGRHDPATTVTAAESIKAGIPGAAMTVLDAAHLSNIEQPDGFAEAVLTFLRD